jgi:hypothetical protein
MGRAPLGQARALLDADSMADQRGVRPRRVDNEDDDGEQQSFTEREGVGNALAERTPGSTEVDYPSRSRQGLRVAPYVGTRLDGVGGRLGLRQQLSSGVVDRPPKPIDQFVALAAVDDERRRDHDPVAESATVLPARVEEQAMARTVEPEPICGIDFPSEPRHRSLVSDELDR